MAEKPKHVWFYGVLCSRLLFRWSNVDGLYNSFASEVDFKSSRDSRSTKTARWQWLGRWSPENAELLPVRWQQATHKWPPAQQPWPLQPHWHRGAAPSGATGQGSELMRVISQLDSGRFDLWNSSCIMISNMLYVVYVLYRLPCHSFSCASYNLVSIMNIVNTALSSDSSVELCIFYT